MRHYLITGLLASSLGAGLVWAQTPAPTTAVAAAAVTTPAALTIRDIYDRMLAAGYHDMKEIERERGQYKVKASNAQGERVKLYVNAQSGAIERQKIDK